MTLEEQIERIAEKVFERMFEARTRVPKEAWEKSERDRARLALLMSKRYVTVAEAAFLLGCSDGHVRNLVGKAKKRATPYPVPFLDLDGVTVFPLDKLLEWAERPKLRKVS
jgi:hypothetical protein